jgi:hypothetical protein
LQRILRHDGCCSPKRWHRRKTADQVTPWHTRIVGQLAGVLARRGERDRSDGLLRQRRAADVAAGIPIGMIQYHVTSGELDGAIDWFERAVDEREPLVVIYANEPQIRRFRSGPRWAALLKTMNLPEAR